MQSSWPIKCLEYIFNTCPLVHAWHLPLPLYWTDAFSSFLTIFNWHSSLIVVCIICWIYLVAWPEMVSLFAKPPGMSITLTGFLVSKVLRIKRIEYKFFCRKWLVKLQMMEKEKLFDLAVVATSVILYLK